LWPQSSERIVGRHNFAALNSNYPAAGSWRFVINKLVAEGNTVVSDVSVTDGHVNARAITFSTVVDSLVVRQVEFWPDESEAPVRQKEWGAGSLTALAPSVSPGFADTTVASQAANAKQVAAVDANPVSVYCKALILWDMLQTIEFVDLTRPLPGLLRARGKRRPRP
jgi:hypothetical protein